MKAPNSFATQTIVAKIKLLPWLLLGMLSMAHAGQDSLEASHLSAQSRLLPRQILIGPQIGFTGSRFMASPEYKSLIEPTPARDGGGTALSLGALITARWSHWFSLSLNPHRETYVMETRERTVAFPDNPFPHTLRASTELAYNIWPIAAGMGWFTPRQHFQFQLGIYQAYLDHSDIHWTVDGDTYPNLPHVEPSQTLAGWSLGSEYGIRVGSGDVLAGIETQREFASMLAGLEGSLKAQSTRFHLSYAWSVWSR